MAESIRNQNDYDASVNFGAPGQGRQDSRYKARTEEILSRSIFHIRKMRLNIEDASLMIALLPQWRFSRGSRAFYGEVRSIKYHDRFGIHDV